MACLECGGSPLSGTYRPSLVLLSIVIAMVAAYTALDLAGRISSSPGLPRRVWLVSGATMMGLGIWSMHFVGMLAFSGPMAMTFDGPVTLLSMLAAVIGSGIALFVVSRQVVTVGRLAVGGLLMGLAIASMHYIGMAAMRMNVTLRYNPWLVAASLLIAIGSSVAALWLAFRLHAEKGRRWNWLRVGSAVIMGSAIAGMHYTGMAAAIFERPTTPLPPSALSGFAIGELGAFAIGSATLLGLGLTLLSSLVDLERRRAQEALRFLAHASSVLGRSLDPKTTLENLAGLVVPTYADFCIIDLLEDDEGSVRHAALAGHDATYEPLLKPLRERRHGLDLRSEQALARVVRTCQSLFVPKAGASDLEALAKGDAQELDVLRKLGVHGYLVVPIIIRDRVRGALFLLCTRPERQLMPTDVSLLEDLGRRAGAAVENARLYHEAQEAVRARDEFLSIASHELRTPLTPLQLHLQSLKRTLATASPDGLSLERLASKVDVAERQEKRLSRLVAELLEISRIRLGKLELQPEEVNLPAVVSDVIARYRVELAQAGCTVHVNAPEALTGLWDRTRLEQVVTNLVTNAARYGHGKPIDITVAADEQAVRLVVRDHGIGIAPEDQHRIFERFERAASRNFGGLGLGLYIARQIVEAHGGRIQVSSELGVGSSFTVELPLGVH
jgi:NO-binding membrane sensor protein with MHYT domain/signal transduction histidine kinase